jgi:hypothetical protein
MRLRGRSDAPVVTGRVARWHLTLMEIPSAGADPVTSVHKNLFAGGAAGRGPYAIRALPDLCGGIVSGRLEAHSSRLSPLGYATQAPARPGLSLSLRV